MAWSYVISDRPQTHYSFPNNAQIIYDRLIAQGLTHASVIGILANMEHESYINPAQMEIGYNGDTSRGYGLVQWTPASSKILAYASSVGGNWYDGNIQMAYFDINVPQSWGSVEPYTWNQYKQIRDINTATLVFFKNFERGTFHEALYTYASYWDNYFIHPTPPTPTDFDDLLIPFMASMFN